MHLAFRYRVHSLACIAATVRTVSTNYTRLFTGTHFSSDLDVDVTDAMAIDLDLESVFELPSNPYNTTAAWESAPEEGATAGGGPPCPCQSQSGNRSEEGG
jgi:hypothetical protein